MTEDNATVIMNFAVLAWLHLRSDDPNEYAADLEAAAQKFEKAFGVTYVELNSEGGDA